MVSVIIDNKCFPKKFYVTLKNFYLQRLPRSFLDTIDTNDILRNLKVITLNVWNYRDIDSIRNLIKISALFFSPVIKDSHLLHCWLIFWLLRININHKRLCWISKCKNAEIQNRPLLHFLRSDFYILSFSSLRLYRRVHPLPTNCLHCLCNLPCFQSLSRIKTKRHKSIDV